jgi:hypothetical protein
MFRATRNDHDIALAADPMFGAKAELHLALKHPHDLFIWVTVRLDMDTGSNAPPHNHPLVAGKNAAPDLSLICSSGKAANVPNPTSVGINLLQFRIAFGTA